MIGHLTDQMSICLGDKKAAPMPGVYRWPGIRYVTLYLLPWPQGRVRGPPEAFETQPESWSDDVASLIDLVEPFCRMDPGGHWPDHALFGRMSGAEMPLASLAAVEV